MDVFDNIKEYIKRNGPSQTITSRKSGVPYKRLNDILNGRAKASVEEYFHICDAIGVPLDFFRQNRRDSA